MSPSRLLVALILAPQLIAGLDLARPTSGGTRLSDSPSIWLSRGFLAPSTVAHMLSKVPANQSAYAPCIGQVDEFESKRCTMLPVAGDPVIEAALAQIGAGWNMDTAAVARGGLPIIRYLPGAPPVGKHGDEDRHGVVPNATLVIYLTNGDGKTVFPEADVSVSPEAGAVLSFQNVDAMGLPHPRAKHLVSAVPNHASGDRLIVQIPISHRDGQSSAYPEHVSGNKKPGEHEFLHGTAEQKAAGQAALAVGCCIAVAYMAALQGKFAEEEVEALAQKAQEAGGFTEDDFKKKE